jgi:hypothetical protein
MPEFKERICIDDVTILRTTDMALLCEIDGSEYWIPQSQIDDDSEVWEEGDEGMLVISKWIADQKGLG